MGSQCVSGYVILVILVHTVRGTYIIRDVAVPDDDGESLMHQSLLEYVQAVLVVTWVV